jgi:hypothetical protein
MIVGVSRRAIGISTGPGMTSILARRYQSRQVPSTWSLDKRAWLNFLTQLIAKAACRLKSCAKITTARIYYRSFVIGRLVNGEMPQQGRQSTPG